MKPIAKKYIFLAAAALLILAAATLVISGSIDRLIRVAGFDQPVIVPHARNTAPVAGKPQVSDSNDKSSGANQPAPGVTRAFFKPPGSKSAEAVRLEIKAVERNNELMISGSLRDGSACRRLQIDIELKADDGRKLFHTLMLGDSGRTEAQPIRSKRRLPPSAKNLPAIWSAHVAAIRCLDP